jgi:hypothetical protein
MVTSLKYRRGHLQTCDGEAQLEGLRKDERARCAERPTERTKIMMFSGLCGRAGLVQQAVGRRTCVNRRRAVVHVSKGKDDLRCKGEQRDQREPTMPAQRPHDGPSSRWYNVTLRRDGWSSIGEREAAFGPGRVSLRAYSPRAAARAPGDRTRRRANRWRR